LKVFADFVGGGKVNRTGVSFLLGDADLWQVVNDGLSLDL
jgi:hypothetical protein